MGQITVPGNVCTKGLNEGIEDSLTELVRDIRLEGFANVWNGERRIRKGLRQAG